MSSGTNAFTVIDVETANPNFASICQIGLARFEDAQLVDAWQSLVNPEDYFADWNMRVHGITPADVAGASTFPGLHREISARTAGRVLVSHTGFDRASLTRASARYQLPALDGTWLDSAMVARRTWPDQCGHRGYGLQTLAATWSLAFTAHVAIEDAKVTGWILLKALGDSGFSLAEWLARVPPSFGPIAQRGNPEGSLLGHVIAFTGALSMVRREAAGMAAAAGCTVHAGVTRDTTLLVVGDQDISQLVGFDKSSKHRKAEVLIRGGQSIRIIGESDFVSLLALDRPACPAA